MCAYDNVYLYTCMYMHAHIYKCAHTCIYVYIHIYGNFNISYISHIVSFFSCMYLNMFLCGGYVHICGCGGQSSTFGIILKSHSPCFLETGFLIGMWGFID